MARRGQVASTSNRRRGGAAAAADVTYVKAHINRGSAGNNVLDLEFSDTVTGSDFETGITIGVGINGSTSDYTAIDKSETSSIGIVSDKYIRYTFDGTVSTFQGWDSGTSKGHNLQVEIESSPLNVADLPAGAAGRDLENNSTVNLLDGIVEVWHLADVTAEIHAEDDLCNDNLVTFVTGKLGNGAQMSRDTPAKYLSLPDSARFSPGDTDWTWSFWVNYSTEGIYQHLINKWNWSGSAGAEFQIIVNSSNNLGMTKRASGGNVGKTWGATVKDTWYNVVAYHETGVGIGINANYPGQASPGTLATQASTTGMDDGTLELAIGAASDGNPSSALDGIMDEVAFHSKVLSADEVTDLYNGGDGKAYPYIPDIYP